VKKVAFQEKRKKTLRTCLLKSVFEARANHNAEHLGPFSVKAFFSKTMMAIKTPPLPRCPMNVDFKTRFQGKGPKGTF